MAKKPYEDNKALGVLRERLIKAQNLRRREEELWILSIAVLNNIQGIGFNSRTGLYITVPGFVSATKTDNRLMPRYRRQLADFLMAKLSFSVVPNTNDESDIQAAKVGEKVLEGFFINKRMSKTKFKIGSWIFSCGNCFLEDIWDDNAGPVEIAEDGKLRYKGDVSTNVWSPFEFLKPASFADDTELDTLPWIVLQKWTDTKEIEFKFGFTSGVEALPSYISVMRLINGEQEGSGLEQGAFVYKMYSKPCKEFPQGLFLVATQDKVIEMDVYPYNNYPVEHFKDIDVPGRFWGRSTLSYGLGLQERFDRTLDSIDTYNERMGKGRLLVPNQCNLTTNPSSEHGEILNYDPILGQSPKELGLNGLPQTYITIIDLTLRGFQDLYSQHEVTRGTNASDIRSGSMVALLREQDAINNVPSHALASEALARFGARVLKRIQKGYTSDRVLKILSKDQQWEVQNFQGADLKDNTDVRVTIQPDLADSRLARENRVLEKYREGLYGDPADPNTKRIVLNLMEDAVVEDMYSANRLDEGVAKRENNLLMSGGTDEITINMYDNDVIHLREHMDVQKRLEFQELKQSNPEMFGDLTQKFNDHVSQHMQALQDKLPPEPEK